MKDLRGIGLMVLGVALITALIGLVRPWLDVPSLAVCYVLLVLWVGAVYGRLRAVGTAVLAFLVYEFFFVPPYGTLLISAPKDVLNLLVLLGAAVLGGTFAASLQEARATAQEAALTAESLYAVAVSALRAPDVGDSLRSLVEAAARVPGIESMTLLDARGDEVLAGPDLPARQKERARWALRSGRAVGLRVHDGRVDLLREAGARTEYCHLPMPAGGVSLHVSEQRLEPGASRLLAALLALAGLLLDRRRAELEAERLRELEVSDRLKAAVLSSISHELKSPLASLRAGLSTLSLPEAGLRGDEKAIVEGLDSQADRLNRLVGDMLVMSRLEAGLPFERQAVSVDELVGSALRELEPVLAGFEVVLDVEPDLPPVLADESQMQRVLVNLLANAAEWTEPGGRIDVGAGAVEGGLKVWVQNEGERIPPVDLDRVFDKFWTTRRSGSGLGLAICRRVVEAHGGTIRAENRRAGPRFTLTLPAAVEVAKA